MVQAVAANNSTPAVVIATNSAYPTGQQTTYPPPTYPTTTYPTTTYSTTTYPTTTYPTTTYPAVNQPPSYPNNQNFVQQPPNYQP